MNAHFFFFLNMRDEWKLICILCPRNELRQLFLIHLPVSKMNDRFLDRIEVSSQNSVSKSWWKVRCVICEVWTVQMTGTTYFQNTGSEGTRRRSADFCLLKKNNKHVSIAVSRFHLSIHFIVKYRRCSINRLAVCRCPKLGLSACTKWIGRWSLEMVTETCLALFFLYVGVCQLAKRF